ncbi:MAG: PEGA domain-containing protein [Kiritimatiellae bacterium]|jgi:hypothetical protein|nr:PEGA domain-containing protein [Kiritimatiellia bacterium]
MKIGLLTGLTVLALTAGAETSAPLKIALLDFENQAGVSADKNLVGNISPQAVANKGAFALMGLLANNPGFVLIDRRDFIGQMKSIQLKDGEKTTTLKPSFLRAAQALNADAVLKGCLLSYSPGKQIVNQGGYKTEFTTLSLRITLQALDTRDGAVIASSEGSASQNYRQSDVQQTVVGEDQLLDLLQNAMKKAVPALNQSLQTRFAGEKNRPTVKLSVKTDADPALVEIDGLLIGTTPLNNFQVYAGDHILSVGKAGYQDVTKAMLLKADTAVEVPLFRTKLSAEEVKGVLDKARINVVTGTMEPAVIIGTVDAETGK